MRLRYYNSKTNNIYKFYIQYLQIRNSIDNREFGKKYKIAMERELTSKTKAEQQTRCSYRVEECFVTLHKTFWNETFVFHLRLIHLKIL